MTSYELMGKPVDERQAAYVVALKRKADALDVLLADLKALDVRYFDETEDTRWTLMVFVEAAVARAEADAVDLHNG